MLGKELLKQTLYNMINAIDSGSSNYTEDEYNEIIDTVNRITNTKNRISKYQACKYLNISRATFDNWVKSGKLPKGEKTAGFKELSWELSTLKWIKDEH